MKKYTLIGLVTIIVVSFITTVYHLNHTHEEISIVSVIGQTLGGFLIPVLLTGIWGIIDYFRKKFSWDSVIWGFIVLQLFFLVLSFLSRSWDHSRGLMEFKLWFLWFWGYYFLQLLFGRLNHVNFSLNLLYSQGMKKVQMESIS